MSRIFNFRKREVAPAACEPVSVEEPQARGASFGDRGVYVGGRTNGALTVSAFHRALELRANTMSQLTMSYQRFDRRGGNFLDDNESLWGRRYNYLMQVRPNPIMTWTVLMRQAEILKVTEGNAVIYIDRDDTGEIDALWLCDFAGYNAMANTYDLSYYAIGGPRILNSVPAADVIHIRNTYTRDNGLVGIPTLTFAARSLNIAATIDSQTMENSAKGGKMKLLLQEEKQATMGLGRASKKELEKVKRQLNEDLYADDVVLLTNVANVTPISQNAQQMELLESRKFGVSDIARFMSVPKVLLMDDSNSSYKSPEAATQEFLVRTIAPAIREWENELDAKIIGAYDREHRFHLCELPLMRLDPKGQAEIDKLHLETGVKSVNELRAQYDMPAIKEGDKHYISTNLAAVGSEKLEKGGAA